VVAAEEPHDVRRARFEIPPKCGHVETLGGGGQPAKLGRQRRLAGLLGDQARPDLIGWHRPIRQRAHESVNALLSFG
jgi:hypothetical protein